MRERCSNNHPYTPDNTRIDSRGSRICIQCRRERDLGGSRDPASVRGDWRADDLDWVVVERFLQGHDPGRPLHPRELREVARTLAADGLGASALAKLTKCNTGTAQRLMAEVELSTSRERETSRQNRETLKSALLTAGGES